MLYPSFIFVTKANQLVGAQVEPANTLVAVDSTVRDAYVAAAQGLSLDEFLNFDLSKLGFGKTFAAALSFTGTTPITLNINTLATGTGIQTAGTALAAFWNHLIFQNVGVASSITIAPAGSNPINSQLGGTSPTMTLAQNDALHWFANAGEVVSTSHCQITFTPTAAGTLLIGGAGS
jgi:hypothetical protein